MAWNWARNVEFSTDRVVTPSSVEELQEIIARERRVKVQGTRHSFNTIADGEGVLVSMEKFSSVELLADGLVRVGGGDTYGAVAPKIHQEGWALANLASLPHISVAGACATATHGSGAANQNLSASVVEMAVVDGRGRLRIINRRDDADFNQCVVHLGALGVVVALTLRAEPTYQVAQTVYENLSLTTLEENFDAVRTAGYSVSLFTTWEAPTFEQVWVKRRVGREDSPATDLFGAQAATAKLHPLAGCDPVNCTEQLGVPGPWHERLPHFRMEFTPSAGEELQSEYFVRSDLAPWALRAVDKISHMIAPLLQVSEIRFVAADDLLLSPARGDDVVGIHFTWKKDWEGVRSVLPLIEKALEPFGGVPHWGKLSTLSRDEWHVRCPNLAVFAQKAREWDPRGRFRNAFLDAVLGD